MPSDSPRPRRRPRLGPFLVLLSLLAACATGTDTRALRELTPAALVVVVDAVPPAAAAGGPLQFTATAAEMQSMLAAELRVLGLGSRVVARQDLGKDEADIVLTLTPRRPIEFAHRGVAAAGNVIGSTVLWVTTWIGSLLIPDSNYTIGMDASAAVAMPGLERAGFDLPVKGGDVDLTFFDRNQFFSWPLVQSFVLPSFLTTDQAAVTSASLTRACMHEAAVQITAQLKQDFERLAESRLGCGVRLETPRNGQRVTATTMPIVLTAVSRSQDPVHQVTVSVNGGPQAELQLGQTGASLVEARGELKFLQLDRDNWIRIRVVADKVYTRTLRLSPRQ
jgi:hypothetical protein